MARKPDVTLAQLRYFIEAANTLSMTAAAEQLFVAQSAVSSAISQLEKQMGAQLFVRQRSKGLALTAAGQQFLGDARALLLNLDEALDTARGIDNQVRGTIRIGCFVTLAPFVLPAIVARVRAAHPYLDIEVDEVDADEAREALRSGRVELLIGYDFALGNDIRRTVLAEAPPHVLIAAEHPLSAKKRVHLRELSREPMILLDLPHSRDYFLGILASVGLQPEIRHRTMNYETVRAFVAHGHGFSILNQRPRHDLSYDGERVVALRIADDVPALPIVLASMRSIRTTARARAVAEVASEVVAEALPA
ncbi:LysR family transcriptional regulator [Pseudolysinimonas kribbensis]|uniref:LysR family transcriptional regulator n=1 Tax=Pseudolysinimonas kribbensis TaxID=433641 RepID=A0ABQ6K7E5_9MICO|nr:LysR substrate-binding domain-containing protein [Pseudolysinimonas kribbensis]GMA94900.1 LysR family transcriptional regulator [Pseudolysinimonas kribbensis]